MKIVTSKDTVKKWTKVEGDVVTRHHVTVHGEGSDRVNVELTWKFDFTGVPREAILELASRAVLIGTRPRFRSTPRSAIEEWDNKTISVAEYLERERGPVDPAARIRAAAAKLSPEQLAELLKELEEQTKAK